MGVDIAAVIIFSLLGVLCMVVVIQIIAFFRQVPRELKRIADALEKEHKDGK